MGNTPMGQVELERLRSRLLTIFFALVAGFCFGRWEGSRIGVNWLSLFCVAVFGLFAVASLYAMLRLLSNGRLAWGRQSWLGPFQGLLNQFHLSAWCFVALGAGMLLRNWHIGDRIGLVPLCFGIGLALGTRLVGHAEATSPAPAEDSTEASIGMSLLSWFCGMLVLASALTTLWTVIDGSWWVRLSEHAFPLSLIALLLAFALAQLRRTRFSKFVWLAMLATVLVPVGIFVHLLGFADPFAWLLRLHGRYPMSFVAAACMPVFAYAFWAFRCSAQRAPP